ncbi:MAG: sulfate permease, partial [Bacteroidota bacterium]
MLIPQGMAYAMLAGLPPIHGLYAVTLPLLVYALLGTSRQLAVGPVAMVSLLTATGVGAIAEVGTTTFLTLAILLAFVVGAIQLLLGVFRLGFLVNLLSHPVISGFTSAAALIIGLSQLKHLLGIDIARSHHIHEIVLAALERITEINVPTLLLGGAGIGLILGAKRINKSIPGPLVAVVAGVLAVWSLGLEVKIVGEVPSGLPAVGFPVMNWNDIRALIPMALTIALVGFMESIAVAKAVRNRHKDYDLDPNQELIALGAANLAGAAVQSYPVTGGFSRTAVNDQAGAKTGLASIISAGLIVLTLLFLTPLFYYLPKAILASVIMVAVFGLIDWKEPIHLWKIDRSDFWMLLITFVATLSLGIELGIGVGVGLSLVVHIYRSMRPHLAVLGRIPGTNIFRNTNRFADLEETEGLLIVRFDGVLYYGNLTYFRSQLNDLIRIRAGSLKHILINAEGIASLDSSALHELHHFIE